MTHLKVIVILLIAVIIFVLFYYLNILRLYIISVFLSF